ncbi:MAG: FtsX-like permease family protein, partial [Cellulosilyticaceae bacterium]
RADELVISEAFLEANPQYQLGSTLSLTEGSRQVGGQDLDQLALWQEGEVFEQTMQAQTYTIVGVISENYEYSDSPFFLSLGYSDELLPHRDYVVYVKLGQIRDTYQVLPDIAQRIGMTPGSNGKYPILYNRYLLEKFGVFEKGFTMQFVNTLILWGVIAVVVCAFFVVIIYHTFAVSTRSRIKYLGLLKSIGASPKQIQQSVCFEGLLLSVVGIPIGLLGGYGVVTLMIGLLNQSYEKLDLMEMVVRVHCNVWMIVLIVLAALAVVMISAYLPARHVARMSPIVAIKQEGGYAVKKRKYSLFTRQLEKHFGVEGSLAMKSHYAHKKGFRAAFISLTLSFSILVGGMLFYNVYQFLYFEYIPPEQVVRADYEMKLRISEVPTEKAQQLEQELKQIKEVSAFQDTRTSLYGTYMAKEGEFSAQIMERGLSPLQKEHTPRDGKYALTAELITIDDEAFARYCQKIGVDVANFGAVSELPKAILYNRTLYDKKALIARQEYVPLVDWQMPYQAAFVERKGQWDESNEVKPFVVEVVHGTDVPPDYTMSFEYYQIVLVMPESQLPVLLPQLGERNQTLLGREMIYMDIPKDQVAAVKSQVETIYEQFLERDNFYLWDVLTVEEEQKSMILLMVQLATLGVAFISLIGIVNIYSTMSHQVMVRRREFAMLKSAGLSPQGLRKMLFFECILYSTKPILYSIIPLGAFGIWLLYLAKFGPWMLFEVFPYGVFVGAGLCMGAMIFVIAYGLAHGIEKEAIVDVIKDES